MAAGFMSGFGTTLANSIEQDREYYREAASKRRDYLQTYGTRAVVEREDKANAAMGTLNTLRTAGVDDNTLRYVLDKGGIQGIAQLSAKIGSRNDLTKADISGLVKGAKDYVSDNPDESFSAVINRAYGLYQSTDKPVERERNIFSAVLGLDSRMAEDEVLDDLYVNGYSGRDVYRIMGSSGPKAKESISFNLPAKPPTVGEISLTNTSLKDKFNAGISSRLNLVIQAKSNKDNTPAKNKALVEERKMLEALKGRGVQGYADWAKIDSTFWDYAKSIEEVNPGFITRNPTLVDFGSAYTQYWGDKTDDANMNSDNTGGKGTGGKGTGGEGEVIDFKDLAAFSAAFGAGEITKKDRISIDGVLRDWAAEPIDEGKVEVLSSSSINPLTATGSEPVTIPEAAAEGVTTALLAGQNTREALGTIADVALPEGELTASYLNATDTMTSALNRGAANAADFIYGVMGGTEQTNVAEWLRSDADRIDAKEDMTAERVSNKANQIAKAYVDGMNSWFSGLFSKETKAEATENVAKVLSRGSDTPAAKALLETIQERVDYARNKRNEKVAPSQVTEQGLMSKRLDDTNRRISEEDAAMSVDYPQPLDTVTINGPTSEERLMDMPVKPSNELMSVVKRLAGANDEEKLEILSKYIGEDGLPIFGPNYAAERLADTNRRVSEEDAAMAVALPQPLQEILVKVEAELGSEMAGALATGYQQVTMGSTELNSPSILAALSEVEEALGPEASEVLIESFIPATMSATELNTPAIKAAIAKMPAKDRASGQDVINAYLTAGVKFKNEAEANAWIDKTFKGSNISKNIVKSLSKVLANDSNK